MFYVFNRELAVIPSTQLLHRFILISTFLGARSEYNDLIGKAVSAEAKADRPILKVTSASSGKTIQVNEVLKPGNAQAWRAERLDIGVRAHRKATKENQNTLSAVVIQKDGVEKPIGVISAEEIKKHGLKPGHTLRNAEISLEPGITKTQVQAMFKQSQDYLKQFRQNIPEQEKESLAAALWHVSHTKNGAEYRKSSVALNLFPEQVIKQLEKPPVREMQIGGMAYSAYPDKIWQGERVNCEVQKMEDKNSPNYGQKMLLVEGKPLGRFVRDSSSLQLETKFAANLSSPLGAYVMATTAKGNEIKIGQIKNFSYHNNQWKDKPVNLKLGYHWIKNKKEPVALIDGKVLGVIHRDSVKELTNVGKEGRNLITEGYSPQVSLTRTPPTIVDVKLDTDSIEYPWSSQSQSKEAKFKEKEISQAVKAPSQSLNQREKASEAAKIVAPIVQDFLKLKKTENYQGQRYNAAWKKSNQTLTLEDSTGSTKLEAQFVNGEWQSQVDNLTADDVKVFQDMKPMIQEQLQENSSIEQKRQNLRQEYEKLKSEIQAKPDFQNAGIEKKDIAIAMLVLDKESKNPTGKNLLNLVGKVLSQSDQLREWKGNMPEAEYRGKAKEYIVGKFEQASQIRTSILAERQQDFDLAR